MIRVFSIVLIGVFIYLLLQADDQAIAADAGGKAAKATETGDVSWNRGFADALAQSKRVGKPVLALFQEVPGCKGCKEFGQIVLRQPQIVEAIEEEFIPVLIYNNKTGRDAELLQRYNEPSWNFQVIRFFDSDGKDIIPRRDRVWTASALAQRMIHALEQSKREVPGYLKGLSYLGKYDTLKQIAFAQYCFWTGEQRLGGISGVIKTEAGYLGGDEVTRVWFDSDIIGASELVEKARGLSLADKVFKAGEIELGGYRSAPASDQKRQLKGTRLENASLTAFQLTKINAYLRVDRSKALEFLSPRERRKLGL